MACATFAGALVAATALTLAPAPIVAKLEGWHKQIAQMPDIKDALQKIASVPLTLGSAETAAKLAGEVDKWGPIIKAAGIVPQE